MGQCQYKNLQGEHTCNIDTKLFKDSSQEDLFPDYCYFHQIGCVFFDIYRVLYHNTADSSNPISYNDLETKENDNIKNIPYKKRIFSNRQWLQSYAVKPVLGDRNNPSVDGGVLDKLPIIDMEKGISNINTNNPDERRINDLIVKLYFHTMQLNITKYDEYYANFNDLMTDNNYKDIEINIDGFYFPVAKYNAPIKLSGQKIWKNRLKITNNLFIYEPRLFEDETGFFSNPSHYLRSYYDHYGSFTSSSGGGGNNIYKIEFENITFENAIFSEYTEFNKGEHNTTFIDIDFLKCTFNSSVINLHVNNLNLLQNTRITNKNLDLQITTTQTCSIKKSILEPKNITIKAYSLDIEYTELHSDNTDKIELHVPFSKLKLKNPFGMKRLFGEKAIVDIYDG